jgi:hypothetical protein
LEDDKRIVKSATNGVRETDTDIATDFDLAAGNTNTDLHNPLRKCAMSLRSVITFITLALCSCTFKETTVTQISNNEETNWVSVAVIDGSDQYTRNMVATILRERSIPSSLEGSVVYSVSVPKSKSAEAERVLRQDGRLNGKWIQFPE